MEAMIFAAGLGTRLMPLTQDKPKALVNFRNRPMIDGVLEKLLNSGFNRIIINVHHHSKVLIDYIKNLKVDAEVLISDETDFLLDTGGGMLKAKDLLIKEDNFLLYNVDVASELDLKSIYNYHIENKALATLAVKKRESTRNLIFDKNNNLCSWKNFSTNQEKVCYQYDRSQSKNFAFSGISVVNSKIFDFIEYTGKFSITNLFLDLAKNHKIICYEHNDFWADLGTIEKIKEAEKYF